MGGWAEWAVGLERFLDPFDEKWRLGLVGEERGGASVRCDAYQHGAGCGRLLKARSQVYRIAKDRILTVEVATNRTRHHGASVDTDANLEAEAILIGDSGAEWGQDLLHFEGGAHGSFGVILV